MKKLFLSILVSMLTILSVNADTTTYAPTSRVSTVGNTLITKNGLPAVTFAVVDIDVTNSDIMNTKTLNINNAKLKYAGNDNETAAIMAQEMGAIVNAAASKKSLVTTLSNNVLSQITDEKLQNVANYTQQFALNTLTSKGQMEADITGVDLMINAGYNPLAMIVVLGKMDGSLVESLQGQPANYKRSMNIYDYLSYNYPDAIKNGYGCNEYRNFVAYIQPTIDKRNSDKKVKAKFEKEQSKAKTARAKALLKYKVTGGVNAWDVTQTLLNQKTK